MEFVHHHENQLLFNLDNPSIPTNMAVKFRKPEPIFIEKLGVTPLSSLDMGAKVPPVQFSSLSEDQLSTAIQLARRDMKKKKFEEELQRYEESQRSKVKPVGAKKVKNKIVYSRDYKDKLKKRQDREKDMKAQVIKAQNRLKHVKQSDKLPSRAAAIGPRLHIQHDLSSLPARSMSPPTRDIDQDVDNPDKKALEEIWRLRKQMERCMEQAKRVEANAKTDRKASVPMYAEDIEMERKRALRAEEYATRSARVIYMLEQQVRGIQDDITKLGPSGLNPARRSGLLNRLAAVHRATMRALQTFMQHLTDCNLQTGMPRSYQQLSSLLRQLSLCCAQLEVAGETGVPDSIRYLLKDVAELNEIVETNVIKSSPKAEARHCTRDASSPRSPGRPCRREEDERQREPSPTKRRLFEPEERLIRKPVQKVVVRRERRDKDDQSRRGYQTMDRLKKHDQEKGVNASPDREAVLRAGIAALMRAADREPVRQPVVPHLDLPTTPRTPQRHRAGLTWDIPQQSPKEQRKKALLLPSKLQGKGAKSRQKAAVGREAGYAACTVSSKLKEVPPQERQSSSAHSTPRKQPQSPGRGAKSPKSPRNKQQEENRQMWLNRNTSKQRVKSQRITQLRSELAMPDVWIGDAEERMKTKLRPLLDKAQDICETYATLQRQSQQSLRHRLSEKAIRNVELSADILADMMVHDVLDDTVEELQRLEQDDEVTQQAIALQDAPSYENLLQHLQHMENEQNVIRRKYGTIVYDDDGTQKSRRTAYIDAPYSDAPTTPPPIEVSNKTAGDPYIDQGHPSTRIGQDTGEGIRFTNPKPTSSYQGDLHLTQPGLEQLAYNDEPKKVTLEEKRIPVFLPRQTIENIRNQKQQFQQHLQSGAHVAIGRFNPWQVVDEVADEILDDCLLDIGRELEDINNDIVNHVYMSEFQQRPESADHQPDEPRDNRRQRPRYLDNRASESEVDISGVQSSEQDEIDKSFAHALDAEADWDKLCLSVVENEADIGQQGTQQSVMPVRSAFDNESDRHLKTAALDTELRVKSTERDSGSELDMPLKSLSHTSDKDSVIRVMSDAALVNNEMGTRVDDTAHVSGESEISSVHMSVKTGDHEAYLARDEPGGHISVSSHGSSGRDRKRSPRESEVKDDANILSIKSDEGDPPGAIVGKATTTHASDVERVKQTVEDREVSAMLDLSEPKPGNRKTSAGGESDRAGYSDDFSHDDSFHSDSYTTSEGDEET